MSTMRERDVGEMAHLKYYFEMKNDQIYLNSIACSENEDPNPPDGFIKWYETGDLGEPVIDVKEESLKHVSELSSLLFIDRRINFNVNDYKK